MRQQANKGRASEMLVEMANAYYEQRGRAIVTKLHTKWLPLRDHTGHVVSAKVDEKAKCDYVGIWGKRGIAYDVKENHQPRWRLALLEPHQYQFLRQWRECGGLGFVLLHNVPSSSWHTLFLGVYERRLFGKGMRSLSQAEILSLPMCPDVPGCPVDYLATLEGVL